MKIKNLICIPILLSLTSCLPTGNEQSTEGAYEISISGSDLNYVPATENQLDDPEYMNNMNSLIEQLAAERYNDAVFINFIKAIAWTESTWKHYYEVDGHFYVHRGDNGHSYGIMQIYDTYHGEHPILQDNLEYGIDFAYEKYLNAQSDDCSSGTNQGADIIGVIRRAYAQYNGGNGAICRDNDARDNNLEEAYSQQPWLDYLP